MNDDDLIRRGDALAARSLHNSARAAEITIAALPAAQVAVKPLVWLRYGPGCYTVKSLKEADNGCDVVFYAEKSEVNGYIINTVTKPGYFRCWIDWGDEYPTIEAAKAAAQADYEARIRAALDVAPRAGCDGAGEGGAQSL